MKYPPFFERARITEIFSSLQGEGARMGGTGRTLARAFAEAAHRDCADFPFERAAHGAAGAFPAPGQQAGAPRRLV